MFDVNQVRKDFPILKKKIHGKRLVYLDNAATSQKPRQVIKRIAEYYEKYNANVHRGIHSLSAKASAMTEQSRQKVASFIKAESEMEIIWMRNTTEGLNLIAYTLGREKVKQADGIVVSLLEHHANLVPWQQLAKAKKADLKIIDIDQEGKLVLTGKKGQQAFRPENSKDIKIGALDRLLDKRVKIVAVTQVSNVLGTLVPVEKVVKLVRKKSPEALIVLDAAQSVPQTPVNVRKLGVDFLVFSGHKMLGPTGIGVLWGRRKLLERMRPFLYGGEMISQVDFQRSEWNSLPWKFEAGTPNIAGIAGLAAAIDYLQRVGMETIRRHELELTETVMAKMRSLESKGWVEVYGPRKAEEKAGVVSFNVLGVHAHDTAQILDSQGIAVRSGHHCAMPLTRSLGVPATVRASFYLYNRKEEVDKLIDGIKLVRKVFKL